MQNASSARNENNGHSARSAGNGHPSGHSHGEHKHSLNEWQDAIKEKRSAASDAASMSSTQPNGQGNGLVSTGSMSNGVADFFSPEIFQIVLHNPTTSHQLLQFSQSRFCGENMEFLEKVSSGGGSHISCTQTVSYALRLLILAWPVIGGPLQHSPR